MPHRCVALNNIESPTYILLRDYEAMLSDKGYLEEYEECIDKLKEMLTCTGHVVRARSVAYMAGFCRYLARLVEGYGVSIAFSGIVPGKGSIAHKLLALAAQGLADRHGFSGHPGREAIVQSVEAAEKALEKAGELESLSAILVPEEEKSVLPRLSRERIEELEREFENTKREAKNAAITLLDNLYQGLEKVTKVLGIDSSNLIPLTELQLVDYSFHIIGTPDLILEDPVSKRAIIVEWKTYAPKSGSTTPQLWEMLQAYVYAMLELRRLGYGGRTMSSAMLYDSYIEAFTETDPKKVKVYPMVVHLKGIYSTHPAYVPSASIRKRDDLCEIHKRLVVSALHLVALLAYEREAYQKCKIPSTKLGLDKHIGVKNVTLYRVTPPSLRSVTYTGKPARYSQYPCSLCVRMFKQAADACPKYFGNNGVDEKLRNIFFKMRNEILERHANSMQIYRALYMLKPSELYEAEQKGIPYVVELTGACRPRRRSRVLEPDYAIPAIIIGGSSFRYNFFDRLEIKYELLGNREFNMPVGIRELKLVRYNVTSLERRIKGLEDLEVTFLPMIREGKPVAVYLIDDEQRPITLNTGFFARVEQVELTSHNGKEAIVATLGLPSPALRFGILQFYGLLRKLGCALKPSEEDGQNIFNVVCESGSSGRNGISYILASEVSVDLSRYDLRTLDALYRALEQARLQLAKTEGSEIEEEFENVEEEIQKLRDKIFNEIYYGLISKYS